MAKYDVVRIENRAGGYSEHLGEINATTLESAQDRASVEYECPESCRLVVSECESEETPAKHTQGPWHVGCGNGEGSIFADEGRMRMETGGTSLYPIATINRGWNEDEDRANGILIVAAPELLDSLAELLEFAIEANSRLPSPETREELESGFGCNQFSVAVFKRARAAIAKARGV